MSTGLRADLIDFRHRQRFADRRPRQCMGAIIADAGLLDSFDRGAHHLVIFVVNTGHQAVLSDLAEACIERLRRDARKALRIGAEGQRT